MSDASYRLVEVLETEPPVTYVGAELDTDGEAMAGARPQGPSGARREIGKSILLAIVTLGIYTFVWTYKTHLEMKEHSGEGVGGVLGLVIYILIGPVTYFVIPSEIRKNLYEATGQTSPVRGVWGLWFLLPLIGSFVWFPKVQGALNDYWSSVPSAPSA
jgi:hypothetical protein